MNTIWTNPFTSAMGAGVAVAGILHLIGVNLPFVTPDALAYIFGALGLFAAKDGSK